jgi:hypothetical protein
MTHGSIANVVSENGTALSFESGESWSEVLKQPYERLDRDLHPLHSVAIAARSLGNLLTCETVVSFERLTLRE